MATDVEISELLTATASYYRTHITGDMLGVYCEHLRNQDIDRIKDAIDYHIADVEHGQFFPKVAHINNALQVLKPQPSTKSTARRKAPGPETEYERSRRVAIRMYRARITAGAKLRDGTPLTTGVHIEYDGPVEKLAEAIDQLPLPETDRRQDHAQCWSWLYELFDELWKASGERAA